MSWRTFLRSFNPETAFIGGNVVSEDAKLARLFESVQEYAELYLNAKQRQKGCNGMGEVAMLKDDFVYSMDIIIRHCKEKGYLSEDVPNDIDPNDIDLIARDICKNQ